MRILALIAALALSACKTAAPRTELPPPAPAPVVMEKPITIVVEKRVFVPIESVYTDPLPIARMPLWQCPIEADENRLMLERANQHRAAVGALQGTPVKASGK